jgi:hypothetical protein
MVAPFGKRGCKKSIFRKCAERADREAHLRLPPPITSPHLVVPTSLGLSITEHLLGSVCNDIAKVRIT